jgi:hypothetical protein
MVPFLKFYTEYLANYDDALATLTEWARGTTQSRAHLRRAVRARTIGRVSCRVKPSLT